jgi:hypothetical protein
VSGNASNEGNVFGNMWNEMICQINVMPLLYNKWY